METKTEGSLYLDGVYMGQIPAGGMAAFPKLETGSHRLEMRYEDGNTENKRVTVQKNRTVRAIFSYVKPEAIGDRHAGGIIFYLDGRGGGLVAAPSDQSGVGLFGAIANVSWSDAKRICRDLRLNGYSDWYLPSKEELDLMYRNLHKRGIGGFSEQKSYWSSSEIYSNYVWLQYFADGTQFRYSKDGGARVRAVRAF